MLFSLEASGHRHVTVTSPLLHHPTTIPEIFAGPSWATHPPPLPPRLRRPHPPKQRTPPPVSVVAGSGAVADSVFLFFNVDGKILKSIFEFFSHSGICP